MMPFSLRPLTADDMESVIGLSLAAWAPVFASFEQVLGQRIYHNIYPDWKKQQKEVVETICQDANTQVWVAQVDGRVAGFIAYTIKSEEQTGEVELLAVHPDFQNRGIGTELNSFVLEQMKASGVQLAVVATGGDPGHAPARRCYEKAGYRALPIVRYYQDISLDNLSRKDVKDD